MNAPVLPATIAPPAPFPLVLSQAMTQEAFAPGMRRATYDLLTSAGPIVVRVVAVDPHEPSVRLGSVVAGDRLVSSGETVSSMARRTGAVAGINADYFDIGQTNQPLGVVVRDGVLLRSPSKRIALDVRRDGTVRFENFTFGGSASYGSTTVPVTTFNEWPPQGGAGLVTAAFGVLGAAPGVTVAALEPKEPSPAGAAVDGATVNGAPVDGVYRVATTGNAVTGPANGLSLAFGPAALALANPPRPGDDVTIRIGLVPAPPDVSAAVGGGPLLVANGAPANDPNSPAPEETDVRFPVAGAALAPGGTLLLLSVDGRLPLVSVGVTRPEFGALMLGFGASQGMAFDSGGSATLVARELGDEAATVLNVPSDGQERPVADGLFVYSSAPVGPPAGLAVQPSPIVALAGADVAVRLAVVDAAGHSLAAAHLAGGDIVRGVDRSTTITLRASGFSADVPMRVVSQLSSLDVEAGTRVAAPGATVELSAVGRDESGVPVELGERVDWSADRGSFAGPGRYLAVDRDARIVARAGGATATFVLHVGNSRMPLDYFTAAGAARWQFATAPAGLGGSVTTDVKTATLTLGYDFTAGSRAAYASTSFELPGTPLAFSVDVEGDASGVALRAAFVNALGERRALTLAKRVDWTGWQTCDVALPDDLNPPVRLVSLYAVPSLGGAPVRAAGTIRFRNPSVLAAGTP